MQVTAFRAMENNAGRCRSKAPQLNPALPVQRWFPFNITETFKVHCVTTVDTAQNTEQRRTVFL